MGLASLGPPYIANPDYGVFGVLARFGTALSCERTWSNPFKWAMPRPEAVDELIEHELAVQQVLVVGIDLGRQRFEELGLHLAQSLGRHAAIAGQTRIGLLPLAQLHVSLFLGGAELAEQLLHQFILPILGRENLPQQPRLFSLLAGCCRRQDKPPGQRRSG